MIVFGGLGAGGLNLPNTPDGKNFIAFLCKVFLISLPFSPLLKANMSLFFIVPPEELYATQLSQLQEMGFFDTQENIRAPRATSGNVHAAVERLLGNPGP